MGQNPGGAGVPEPVRSGALRPRDAGFARRIQGKTGSRSRRRRDQPDRADRQSGGGVYRETINSREAENKKQGCAEALFLSWGKSWGL